MSGWLGILALFITTIGGSFGVTFLNNRKELIAMKLKMQEENDNKIEAKLREYIEYVETKLTESNKRAETLYNQYIELQNQSIKREAELQLEKQKTLTAIQELQIVKHEYHVLKEQAIKDRQQFEKENKTLKEQIETMNAQQITLIERIRTLERHQINIENEMHKK